MLTVAMVSAASEDCQHGRPCRRHGATPPALARSGRTWSAVALALLVAAVPLGPVAGAGAAPQLESLVERYTEARARGEVGALAGRVHDDAGLPAAGPRPRPGTAIVLVPFTEALAAALEAARSDARRSMRDYRGTEQRLAAGYQQFEEALRAAGGGHLIQGTTAAADGSFVFDNVPAGEWLLLARSETGRREIPQPRHIPRKQAETFSGNLGLHGYQTLIYWWRSVAIGSAETVSVELTDRNAALTAVAEDLRLPPGSPVPTVPSR